ncbi:hypothetical protein NPIL_499501 [Nephila pilipes]|uniref:Uncharacterized protein n=1 Tax=Nephila pilipes TaxID=299642 RepID=A0A8X6Q078_NEPPI|nr:hypothetical protein NPIL_499501 [Nephila pilipes]
MFISEKAQRREQELKSSNLQVFKSSKKSCIEERMSPKDTVGQGEARREDGQEEDEESSKHDAPPKIGFKTAEKGRGTASWKAPEGEREAMLRDESKGDHPQKSRHT